MAGETQMSAAHVWLTAGQWRARAGSALPHRQRRGSDPHRWSRPDRLAGKYAPLVPVLAELITRADTSLCDNARILGQLDRARQRFAAIRLPAGPTGASR
jgi:hypothetical protein